jgi:glutathione S-transferase
MKLYYSPGACSLSPHIVLCEAGLAADLVKVNLGLKKTEHGDDFNTLNPKGYVPALLLDDGTLLTEGAAIVQYLADQVPDQLLAPANGTVARYQLQSWLNFIAAEVHKSMGAFFNPKLPEAYRDILRDILRQRLDYTAAHLQGHDYLMGDRFSVADAYLFTVLNWAPLVQFDLAPWPIVQAYVARVAARPATRQAMRAEGLLD